MKVIIAILLIIIFLCLAVVLTLVVLARKFGTGRDDRDDNPHIHWPEYHEF